MNKTLLLLCVLAVGGSPAFAQSDPDWLKKPYPLKVVIHVHPHPVLSDDFVRQFKLELSAGLRQHFGGVVDVRTVGSNDSELMKEVLQAGWSVLDGKNHISDEKEHLLQLRFQDGAYEIEARQWDGFTGLCSALRTTRTADRSWVARQATLMVVQDFGVVAEIAAPLPRNHRETSVKLRLKGWNLPDRASALRLQRGEVFAFTRIRMDADGKLRSERLPDALLVVTIYDDKSDECSANWHAHSRYAKFLPFALDSRTVGFRALKLGTRQAPVRLQLVDKQTGNPVTGSKVVVQRGEGSERREFPLRPDDNVPGIYESLQPFAHFAKIVVSQGTVILAEVPVPILSEEVIPLELTGTREALRLAEFQYDYDQWSRPLRDVIDLNFRKRPEMLKFIRERRVEEAVKLAEEMAQTIGGELTQLQERFKDLEKLGTQAGPETKPKIEEARKTLAQLEVQVQNYRNYVQRVRNPTPAQTKYDEAQAAEDSYDYPAAISLYEESLRLDASQDALKTRLDKMKRAWRSKSEKHMEARKFVNDVWRKTEWLELEDQLPELQKHVTELKNAGDYLTAMMVVNFNGQHLKKLAEVQPNLGSSEGDREKAASITKVSDELIKINNDLLEFYRQATGS